MAILGYDVLSECYDELYGGEQWKKYMEAYRRVKPMDSSRVLDVGCGTGLLLKFMRNVGLSCEYVGVDVSSGMLEKALKKLDSMSHLVLADAHHLPFREKVFTHLYCFTVIHHLNIDRFIEEAERLCSDKIIISQHKRLIPKLQIETCEKPGAVDEIIIKPLNLLRKAAGGCGEDSLPPRGQDI